MAVLASMPPVPSTYIPHPSDPHPNSEGTFRSMRTYAGCVTYPFRNVTEAPSLASSATASIRKASTPSAASPSPPIAGPDRFRPATGSPALRGGIAVGAEPGAETAPVRAAAQPRHPPTPIRDQHVTQGRPPTGMATLVHRLPPHLVFRRAPGGRSGSRPPPPPRRRWVLPAG